MPGQRRSAGKRARGSWLPRLAGLGVVVVLAIAGVTAYLVAFHPAATHHAAPLPSRVVSYQTVGLVVANTQPGSGNDQLLELTSQRSALEFAPVAQTQQTQGSPQWTADLMAGTTYIFIYLPTGQCLSAVGTASQPKLTLRHCNLGAAQRWRRTRAPVLTEAHDFYQYANVKDAGCLTQSGVLPGPIFGASLKPCSAPQSASQLVAFWWSV
jgi:hypothetical protein